jgi:hypothetical protein
MHNEGLPIDTNTVVGSNVRDVQSLPRAGDGIDKEDVLHHNPWPAVNSASHEFVSLG